MVRINKLYVIACLILVLTIPLALGDTWKQYQSDSTNIGRSNPTFDNAFNNTNFVIQSKTGFDTFQPINADFDNDGDNEIFATQGSFGQLYTTENGVFGLEGEVNMGGTLTVMYASGDMDGDGDIEIVGVINDTFIALEYNSSGFYQTYSNDSNDVIYSGVTCLEYYQTEGGHCYAVGNNTIWKYDPNNNSLTSVSMSGQLYSTASSSGFEVQSLVIEDIDVDGEQEIVTFAESGNDDGLQVYDLSDGTLEWSDLRTEGTGTYIRGMATGNLQINSDSWWDFFLGNQNLGDLETCITYKRTESGFSSSEHAYIRCYNGDGSTFGSYQITDGSSTLYRRVVTNPIIIDFDGDDYFEVCAMSAYIQVSGGNVGGDALHCVDTADGFDIDDSYDSDSDSTREVLNYNLHSYTADEGYVYTNGIGNKISGARLLDADTNEGEVAIVYRDFILGRSGASSIKTGANLAIDDTDNAYYSITDDFDLDGFSDILIAKQDGYLGLVRTDIDNLPPTINASLVNEGYGSSLNINSPICVNSTVTFSAQNSGGTATGNYDNDILTDQERLVTNCGQTTLGLPATSFTTDLNNGSYDLANPEYGCYFNQTGTFTVRIYLQDEQNDEDFTQYNDDAIIVNVVEGQAGLECNIGSSIPIGADIDTTISDNAIDDSVDEVFDLLLGTSNTLKIVIGLAIVLAIIVGVAQTMGASANAGILSVVGFIALGIVTFIGLIPLWVMIFLSLGLLMLVASKITIFSSNGGV